MILTQWLKENIKDHFQILISDEKQNGVIDGVSEVKIDASAAKKRGPEVLSEAKSIIKYNNLFLIFITIFIPTFS